MRRRIFSVICSSRGETAIDELATAATNANAQLVQLKIWELAWKIAPVFLSSAV
jgi:hypothetical protein